MFFLFAAIGATATAVGAYYISYHFFPAKTQQIHIKMAWHGIKTYCFLEEFFISVARPFRLLLNKSSAAIEPECIVFINAEGTEIVRHTETDFNKLCLEQTIIKDFDYDTILYEFSDTDEKSKYEKHMLFFDNHQHVKNNFKINTKIRFLGVSVKIQVKEETYKININFKDNYAIVGNKMLGRTFLLWFLRGVVTKEGANEEIENVISAIKEDKAPYRVSFIDHRMKCVELNEKQYVRIDADDYTICTDAEEREHAGE